MIPQGPTRRSRADARLRPGPPPAPGLLARDARLEPGRADPVAPVLAPFQRTILLATAAAPAAFLQALAGSARERHWRLVTDLAHTGAVPSRWQGDGMVAFAAYASDPGPTLAATRLPGVTVSLWPDFTGQPRVEPDQAAIGRLAARHLLERECREFVWAPFTDDRANRDRLRGFQAELRAEGYDCHLLPPAYRRIGHAWNDNAREWRQATWDRLSGLREHTGVFAFNDCLSGRVAHLALEAGLAVPGRIAILGVGNDPLDCESGALSLTSIDPDLEGMTVRAADLLEEVMSGRRARELVLHPPKGVVARASTQVDRLHDSRMHQAIAYVATHRADPRLSVASVADNIGISRRQLERDFRNFKGCTVRQYIEEMRMQTAARLVLEQPHAKVLAIADAIGIPDPNRFFRKFRKRFGTTPGAFRRQSTSPEGDGVAKRAS